MAFDYTGKALRVEVDGKSILHEVSFSYGETTEFKEVASKDVDNDVVAGKSSYTLSGNGIADNSDGDAQEDIASLFAWRAAKTIKPFEIADAVSGNISIAGTAYMESVNITGENESEVTYDWTMKVVTSAVGATA